MFEQTHKVHNPNDSPPSEKLLLERWRPASQDNLLPESEYWVSTSSCRPLGLNHLQNWSNVSLWHDRCWIYRGWRKHKYIQISTSHSLMFSWILQCHLIDIYQGTISYTGNHVIPAQWYYITSLSGVTIPHLHLLGIENLWWKHHRPVEAIDMFGRKNPMGFRLTLTHKSLSIDS